MKIKSLISVIMSLLMIFSLTSCTQTLNNSISADGSVDVVTEMLLTKDEYIDIVVSQLEYLSPEIVIHRITGDPKKEDLIEPSWLLKKFCVLNDIDKEMVKRDTYQGIKADENI